jgi:hypothetical protein
MRDCKTFFYSFLIEIDISNKSIKFNVLKNVVSLIQINIIDFFTTKPELKSPKSTKTVASIIFSIGIFL